MAMRRRLIEGESEEGPQKRPGCSECMCMSVSGTLCTHEWHVSGRKSASHSNILYGRREQLR